MDGGRYLIVGGFVAYDVWEKTEVVELIKTNSTPFFGQLPITRWGAAGAMFGNAPILCGGWLPTQPPHYFALDSCISYQNSQWNSSHFMNEKRSYHAGVKINSTTFWLLGGEGYDMKQIDSTEFIIEGQTNAVSGPKLPFALHHMCAVKLSEEEIFVIGGQGENGDYRNEVWIYNPQNGFARNQGPSLNTRRFLHSCSTMRDGEKTIIVVAGGDNGSTKLDSVEIYDPTYKTWHSGKTNSQPQKTFFNLLFSNQNTQHSNNKKDTKICH